MSLRRLLYSIMFGAMPGALANYLPMCWLPLFRAIMFPGSWVFWLDGYVSQVIICLADHFLGSRRIRVAHGDRPVPRDKQSTSS